MGIIIAVSMSSKVIDVSYFLEKRYRGNGYMTEATKEFVKVVRDNCSSYVVFKFQIAKDNIASLNVVKRLGASADHITRENDYVYYF